MTTEDVCDNNSITGGGMKIKNVEITQEDMDRFESKIFVVTEGKYVGCYETSCTKDKDYYIETNR